MRLKRLFLILLIPVVAHLGFIAYFHFGETFHARHFKHGFKKSYAVTVEGLDHSLLGPILNQHFHYLGRGMQMTAFESADGLYVLKLFHPRPPRSTQWYRKNWRRNYSLKHMKQEWFHKERRLEKMFRRLKIAYSVLRQETGLVYVHLSPNEQIKHVVELSDNKGKRHSVHLNQTPFVLQKKAIMASKHLDTLADNHQVEELKTAISKMDQLFAKRLKLAITDQNQNMDINFGYIDGQPIQIDVGSIRVDPALLLHPTEEEQRISDNFHTWLKKRYPTLL